LDLCIRALTIGAIAAGFAGANSRAKKHRPHHGEPPDHFGFGIPVPAYNFPCDGRGIHPDLNPFQISIQVTLPPVPVVSLQVNGSGSNNVQLIVNTLSNASYSVDYTDNIVINPWQPWTNLIGNGSSILLPVDTAVPARIFRIVESP
jgi:hypothetical protein